MAQTTLNFKLEYINEKLTPRRSVALSRKYLKGMRLEEFCNTNLPKAICNNGYSIFEFVYLLILMLHSEGRFLEKTKSI